jgi:succinate-acetate transporter protein
MSSRRPVWGLGVFLVTAGVCMLVPAVSAGAKLVPATVMTLAGLRFAVTGIYQLTGSAGWKAAAGWVGLLLGIVAVYAALALSLESTQGRTVLPLGRRASAEPAGEPGVRHQL